MSMLSGTRVAVVAIFAVVAVCGDSPCRAVDFAHDVAPILKQHCVQCHGGEEAEGGFSLNTRELFLEGEAAAPGDPNQSRFLQLVRSGDADEQMPPEDLPRVSGDQIDVLQRWVKAGLPWADGFTFAKSTYRPPLLPRRVALPGPPGAHPIDQILGRYLTDRNLPTPEPVDDAVFLRRASLDLIGLLPTPEQLSAFESDTSSDKRERLVIELLNNDLGYAEHWLTFWNDLLRNDYTGTGFITGGRKQISGWLYRSLIENKPFDQFTRELVAPPTEASRGFIDGIKWRGNVSAGQTNEIQFAQSVSQSFLGINLKCASCHDSFIDQWKLSDAYALAAVYAETPLSIHRCDKPTGQQATPGWLFPQLGQIDASLSRDERLEQLAALVTQRDNGRYARTIVNRLWAQLMGRGIVHPLDAMHTEPFSEDLLDYLANELVENQYDLKAVLQLIATSQAYRARSEVIGSQNGTSGPYVYAGRRSKRMTAEQFVDSVWQLTGAAPTTFDAPVLRGSIDEANIAAVTLEGEWIWGNSAIGTNVPPAGETVVFRKTVELPASVDVGGAVISADNEFQLYIGRRRVTQSTDWTKIQPVVLTGHLKRGKNEITVVARNAGDKPNPAGLFFEARLQLSDGSTVTIASDPSWRQSERAPIGGREGRLGKTPGPWLEVTPVRWKAAYDSIIPAAKRELAVALSGEQTMVRASLLKSDFLMRSLGRPMRDQIVSSRPAELTTLEAIDLANGETFAAALATGAERLRLRYQSTDRLVNQLYRFALSREPTPREKETIASALGEAPTAESIEDLLWAICMKPEFMMVR